MLTTIRYKVCNFTGFKIMLCLVKYKSSDFQFQFIHEIKDNELTLPR